MDLIKKLEEYKKLLEEKGYEVVYVGLYGSQNYNLHDEGSDVDVRAVVLPTMRQLILGSTTSHIVDTATGQIDVKDVSTFVATLGKGNPAYIESADTDFWVGDQEFRNLITGWPVNKRAIVGMMQEKLKAIEKGLPKSSPMIEKIGYDPKQYHHIVRLSHALGGSHTYEGEWREFMLGLKRFGQGGTLEEVLDSSDEIIIESLAKLGDYKFTKNYMTDALFDYVEKEIIRRITDGRH